jgi:hypothetical protein
MNPNEAFWFLIVLTALLESACAILVVVTHGWLRPMSSKRSLSVNKALLEQSRARRTEIAVRCLAHRDMIGGA